MQFCNCSSPSCLKQILSLHLEINDWLGELDSEPHRSACLGPHLPIPVPNSEIACIFFYGWFSSCFRVFELKSLCLHGKELYPE